MSINEIVYNVFWIIVYITILGLFLGVITYSVFSWFRRKYERLKEYDVTFLQIKLPSDSELETKVAEHLFAGLAGF